MLTKILHRPSESGKWVSWKVAEKVDFLERLIEVFPPGRVRDAPGARAHEAESPEVWAPTEAPNRSGKRRLSPALRRRPVGPRSPDLPLRNFTRSVGGA